MKRHFKLLASVLLVIVMVFAFASCDLLEQYIPGLHKHDFIEGKCECGETDPDYVHTHNFTDGKCECGELEPGYSCIDHVWGEPVLEKDATCTDEGRHVITCTACGYQRYTPIFAKGHTEETIPGYAPSCDETGLTNGSKCTVCGVITEEQKEIPAEHTAEEVPGRAPTCTVPGLTPGSVCSVCGEVLTAQVEIPVAAHNYVDGKCECGAYSDDYTGPKTYVLDAGLLANKDKVEEEGLDSIVYAGLDDFFAIYLAKKTKIEDNSKTFEDGFAGTKRLNWQTKSVIDGDNSVAVIKFTVDGTATIKVWWVSGGDGRTVAIYNEDGSVLVQGEAGSVKNSLYITEFTVSKSGTYYLGNVDGSNNYYKVEATVTPSTDAPTSGSIDVETTDTYTMYNHDSFTFTAGEEGYYTFTVPAGLGVLMDGANAPEIDYYDNVNGGEFTVGLEANQEVTFWISAMTKGNWLINWTFEAGEVEAPVAPECNHWWMPAMGHESMVIPTCQTGGVMVYECWNCGEIKIEEVGPDADYHDYVTDMETYKEATCQTDGYSKQTCSVCGDVKETVFDHETYGWHDYVADAETYKEATCLEAGYAKYTCSVCGDSYEETTPADSVWGHKEVYSSNYSIITCSVCNKVQIGAYVDATETVNGIQFGMSYATGALYFASFNADNSVFEMYGYTATLVDGVYTITLDNSFGYESLLTATITVKPLCGGVIVTITPAEGEALVYNVYETEHLYGEGVETAPTCGAAGYITYTCDACGHSYKEETAPATGEHDYDHVTTDPTCTLGGYTTHTCAFCDYSYKTDETEALGHADTNADYKCDKCSTKMLPADGEALTIPQALAIAKLHASNAYTTQKYYITGVITNVYNTTYGNMYIEDADGNEICIYGLYDATGKTRYDAMSYKPVVGDEVTVYTVLGMYNTTAQGKNAWLDEVVAHDHDYSAAVTAPTCTKAGFTTHTCSICNGYYTDSEVEALGHTTENGECERCGLTIGGDVVNNETFTADFNTVTATNSSYVTSTTTSGWKATNAAVMGGGTSDANPKFKVFGDASTRAFTLNGKTSAKGKLVSPTIADGLSKLTFNYTNCFSESNGVDITITVYQNGTAVASKKLDNNSVTKLTAYTFEWDLAAEGVAVKGEFTIEITNNSPSNSTSNKDRVSIWNLEWTTNK